MKMGGIQFWRTMVHNMLGSVSALYVKTRNPYHSLEYLYVMARLGRWMYLLSVLGYKLFMTKGPLPETL